MLNYFYFHVCSLFSPLSVGKINMFTLCAVWMGKIFNFSSSIRFFLSHSHFSLMAAGRFSLNFSCSRVFAKSTYLSSSATRFNAQQALETFFSEAFLMNSQNSTVRMKISQWPKHFIRFSVRFSFHSIFCSQGESRDFVIKPFANFLADWQILSIALSRTRRTESSFVSRILVTLIVHDPQNQLDAIFSLHCPQFFHISLTYLLCWFSPKVAKSIRLRCFC